MYRAFGIVLLFAFWLPGFALAEEPVQQEPHLAIQVQEFFDRYGLPAPSGGVEFEVADGEQMTPEALRLLTEHMTAFYRSMAELPRSADGDKAMAVAAAPTADPEKIRAFTQKILDFHTQAYLDDPVLREMEPEEGDQILCYYCEYGLNVCLNIVVDIIEDCSADVGNPIFCTNLLFDLTSTCYGRYLSCLPGCSF